MCTYRSIHKMCAREYLSLAQTFFLAIIKLSKYCQMGDNFPQTLPKKRANFSRLNWPNLYLCTSPLLRDEHLFYRADNFPTIILIFWGLCILSCEMSSIKEICLKRLFRLRIPAICFSFPTLSRHFPNSSWHFYSKHKDSLPPFSSAYDGFFVGHVFLWFVYFFRNTWFLSS